MDDGGEYLQTLSIVRPIHLDFAHYRTRIRQTYQEPFFALSERGIGTVYRAGDKPCYVEVEDCPSKHLLKARVLVGQAEPAILAKQIRNVFSLDHDLAAFYAHCEGHGQLTQLGHKFLGARFMRDSSIFAAILGTIISQQINLKFASELRRRLWALAGEPLVVSGNTFYADPTPEAIARLNVHEVRALGCSQRKAEYLVGIGQAVTDGRLDLMALEKMDDESALSYLVAQRGLGPWSAECILMFGLGRTNLLPTKDVGLQRAVGQVYDLGRAATEQEIRQLGAAWHPWRSLYTYYLWLSLSKD